MDISLVLTQYPEVAFYPIIPSLEPLHKWAKNICVGYAGPLDWLAPYCGTVQEIAVFLCRLGFHIAEIADEKPWPGAQHRWVTTTSGAIVYAGNEGMFGKSSKMHR